jgi:protein-S-isoprenylcysteine O-methyltransferase
MSDSSETDSPGIIHEFPRDKIETFVNNGNDQRGLQPMYIHPAYLPGGKRSLPGISLRSFILGITLGISTIVTVQLAFYGYGLWRAPCFVATLALFHYLEFDMTARYNIADASVSSFLLSSNGVAYLAAHMSALAEVLVRYWVYSDYAPVWLRLPWKLPTLIPSLPPSMSVGLGSGLILMGQLVRSTAMEHARANFNHVIQWTKKADHTLVTDGVYAFSRHPSYFGFFWWGLGTQVLLGNRVCFVMYAVVLWKFFHHRIIRKSTGGCRW